MADYHNPNEMRASSSAFAWGDLVFTDYKSGCLRKILIQSRGHQAKINPRYTELGAANENRHEVRLRNAGIKFIREHAFNRPIPGVEGVRLSGHMDFLLLGDVGAVQVDELKSVSSKNTRRNVIKNGNYVLENLAQLVCYMAEARVQKGRLIYTYYEELPNSALVEAVDERIFNVTVDDFGKIAVDSKPTQYHYNDLVAHQTAAARVIKTGEIAARPYRWELNFVSPCTFCPFKAACDKYDTGEIEGSDAFVEYAKNLTKEGATNE